MTTEPREAPAMSELPDYGSIEADYFPPPTHEPNHYDWFMPANPTAAVDEYLDDFEAKLRESLTDPFVHDMAQAVLPLIAAYRKLRAALAGATE